MGRILYEDTLNPKPNKLLAVEDNNYQEPNSVHITDDWDTMIEDYVDEFDDFQDLNFPDIDDDF